MVTEKKLLVCFELKIVLAVFIFDKNMNDNHIDIFDWLKINWDNSWKVHTEKLPAGSNSTCKV